MMIIFCLTMHLMFLKFQFRFQLSVKDSRKGVEFPLQSRTMEIGCQIEYHVDLCNP